MVKRLRIHTALTFAPPPDHGVAPMLQAPVAVAVITSAGSLKRSLALTTRVY